MNIGNRCISLILIVSIVFMLAGCYTTNDIYEDEEREITVTLASVDIISHQNDFGVLYYTLQRVWVNSEGKIEKVEINDHNLPYLDQSFPYSTYSDAVLAKNELSTSLAGKEFVITTKKRELVNSERVFSPVRTGLAIGLPGLGLLIVILTVIFSPPSQGANRGQ